MPADFGLFVTRFNTATPTVSTDNSIREARIDGGGRLYVRPADDRDFSPRYFLDGEAVGAGDRGMLVLGKDSAGATYEPIRVLSDGTVVVSITAGTEASEAADKANANDGEVALTAATWVLVQSKAIASGTVNLDGWSYASDKNTIFQLVLADDTAVDGVDRADVTEILDSQITTSARPSDHVGFDRPIKRNGGTNIYVAVFAKQLQAGPAGVGLSMMNLHTV